MSPRRRLTLGLAIFPDVRPSAVPLGRRQLRSRVIGGFGVVMGAPCSKYFEPRPGRSANGCDPRPASGAASSASRRRDYGMVPYRWLARPGHPT